MNIFVQFFFYFFFFLCLFFSNKSVFDKLGREKYSESVPRRKSLIYFALPGPTHFSNGDRLGGKERTRKEEGFDVKRIVNGEKWSFVAMWIHKVD